MGRPKKDEADKKSERLELRLSPGTKALIEKVGKHHGLVGYNNIIPFLVTKEAKRLKIES